MLRLIGAHKIHCILYIHANAFIRVDLESRLNGILLTAAHINDIILLGYSTHISKMAIRTSTNYIHPYSANVLIISAIPPGPSCFLTNLDRPITSLISLCCSHVSCDYQSSLLRQLAADFNRDLQFFNL